MGKAKRKKWVAPYGDGLVPSEPKHVKIWEYVFQSAAWDHLSLQARCLLIELHRLHNGSNNGSIFMSVREAAARLHVSKNTANAAFWELQEKGFTKTSQLGAFRWKARHATTWILTIYGIPTEPIPTKEFMTWRPAESLPKNQKPVPRGGTDCPSRRDRKPETVPAGGTVGPSERDREGPQTAVHGPSQRDTNICLPRRDRISGDRVDGGVPNDARQPPGHAQDGFRPIGSVLPSWAPPETSSPEPFPVAVGLADLIGSVNNLTSPADQLRAALKAKLQSAPRGEVKRVAKMVNLSHSQISSFVAGRFGLNHGALAVLREYVEGRVSPQDEGAPA